MTTTPHENLTPRERAYHAIRNAFGGAIMRFYQEHPEWLRDERSEQKLAMLTAILAKVSLILDGYEIEDRPVDTLRRRRDDPVP